MPKFTCHEDNSDEHCELNIKIVHYLAVGVAVTYEQRVISSI